MKKNTGIIMLALMLLLAGCSGKTNSGFSEDDLGLEIAGEKYYLREDSTPVIEALGDGYEYSEMVSCVYDGQDKTFAYPGLTVNTVPVEGRDIIEMFTLTDDTYATLRGVKVGMSRDQVIAAYGEEYFDDGYINYTVTNDPADIQAERIQFEMSGDTVSAIYIYSPSY